MIKMHLNNSTFLVEEGNGCFLHIELLCSVRDGEVDTSSTLRSGMGKWRQGLELRCQSEGNPMWRTQRYTFQNALF